MRHRMLARRADQRRRLALPGQIRRAANYAALTTSIFSRFIQFV
jgi:hypothetical protein